MSELLCGDRSPSVNLDLKILKLHTSILTSLESLFAQSWHSKDNQLPNQEVTAAGGRRGGWRRNPGSDLECFFWTWGFSLNPRISRIHLDRLGKHFRTVLTFRGQWTEDISCWVFVLYIQDPQTSNSGFPQQNPSNTVCRRRSPAILDRLFFIWNILQGFFSFCRHALLSPAPDIYFIFFCCKARFNCTLTWCTWPVCAPGHIFPSTRPKSTKMHSGGGRPAPTCWHWQSVLRLLIGCSCFRNYGGGCLLKKK